MMKNREAHMKNDEKERKTMKNDKKEEKTMNNDEKQWKKYGNMMKNRGTNNEK